MGQRSNQGQELDSITIVMAIRLRSSAAQAWRSQWLAKVENFCHDVRGTKASIEEVLVECIAFSLCISDALTCFARVFCIIELWTKSESSGPKSIQVEALFVAESVLGSGSGVKGCAARDRSTAGTCKKYLILGFPPSPLPTLSFPFSRSYSRTPAPYSTAEITKS